MEELEKLKRIIESQNSVFEKLDENLTASNKVISELSQKNLNLEKKISEYESQLKIKDTKIVALEKEVVARTIGDLKKGRNKKRELGEIIYTDFLRIEWYKLFQELPKLTRNRILAEAEKLLDNKQDYILEVREYLVKNIYLPKTLYEKKMFLYSPEEIIRVERGRNNGRKKLIEELKERIYKLEAEMLIAENNYLNLERSEIEK